jgi:hypothetical protein
MGVIGGLGSLSGTSGPGAGPQAGLSALLIIGAGVTIWDSEKAQPIGRLQYRWGTYVGLMSGIGAVLTFLVFVTSGTSLSKGIGESTGSGLGLFIFAGLIVCVPYGVASIGILRRKRFGVVTFLTLWTITVLAMFSPFLSIGARSADALLKLGISALVALLVLVAPNYWYFARRWKFMSKDE